MMSHTRLLCVLAMQLFFSVVALAQQNAGEVESVRCLQMTVAGAKQWVPFSYHAGRGRSRGIAIALAQHLGEQLDVEVKVRTDLPWARIELMLLKGEIDLLAGNYATEKRRQNWLLTVPFAFDETRVFVRKDAPFAFNKLQDLALRRGVVPLGISLGEAFDAYADKLLLTRVNSHEQMFRMLTHGRVDYLVLPLTSGLYRMEQLSLTDKVKVLPRTVNQNSVHLALSKRSSCAALLPEMNSILRTMQRNGEIKKLMQREMDRL